jgi:hypothetical protein
VNPIHHIATPIHGEDVFVTAEFERSVTVWSLAERRVVSQFSSGLDFGGRRLAIISDHQPMVVVGAYHRYGVSTYYASNSQRIWERRDLKRVQSVRIIPSAQESTLIGVGREDAPFLVLDSSSGTELTSLRGVRDAFASADAHLALQELRTGIKLCSLPEWSVIWSRPLESFGVLDVAFGPQGVACSWAAQGVDCFDFDGTVIWHWDPPEGVHVLRVAWSYPANSWVGVCRPYKGDASASEWLAGIQTDGRATSYFDLGQPVETEFLGAGRYVVTSDGEVRTIPTGSIVWRFGV